MNTNENYLTSGEEELPIRGEELTVSDFENAYGEKFSETININKWDAGENLADRYVRLEEEVRNAVKDEDEITKEVRKTVYKRIEENKEVPEAGLHQFNESIIEKCHKGFLFNGSVEACDGISVVHDTLPLSITQIGVCLVSYQGQHGSFMHRLYKRDLRLKNEHPVQEALNMLRQRSDGNSLGGENKQTALSSLARRGIMAYAERAILLEKKLPNVNWLMGHGSPTPYELLSGFWSSRSEMTESALNLMSEMVLTHKKFIYVPNELQKKDLITIGNALRPMEYLILYTLEKDLQKLVDKGGYREKGGIKKKVQDFVHEVGSKIVVGLYRTSIYSPPLIFYSHIDHIHTAALIAMSDGVLQLHKGFPMLLDIADHLCQSTFGQSDFHSSIQQAYSETGNPTRYTSLK